MNGKPESINGEYKNESIIVLLSARSSPQAHKRLPGFNGPALKSRGKTPHKAAKFIPRKS